MPLICYSGNPEYSRKVACDSFYLKLPQVCYPSHINAEKLALMIMALPVLITYIQHKAILNFFLKIRLKYLATILGIS